LLSVLNGLADWDENKGGRSMSQGQTRNGSWMLARSNGRVGRSQSDQEAQSNGGVDWSCGSKEEVFKAMKINVCLDSRIVGCFVDRLCQIASLHSNAITCSVPVLPCEYWNKREEVNSFPSRDSAAMQGRLPIDTVATVVRERLAA
jgi:hypothetical protein